MLRMHEKKWGFSEKKTSCFCSGTTQMPWADQIREIALISELPSNVNTMGLPGGICW